MNAKEMFSRLGYKIREGSDRVLKNFETYVSYENEDDGLRIIFDKYKKSVDVSFYKIHSETPNPITIVNSSIIEAVSQQLKEIKGNE
jgi:hypothetical protein